MPYDASNKLLATIIKVRNIGKVQVHAKKLSFSLKILPYGKNTGTCLNWHDGVSLVEEYDVIKDSNPDDKSGFYIVEPGDEYPELVTTVVPSGTLLMAEAEYRGEKEKQEVWVYETWYIE